MFFYQNEHLSSLIIKKKKINEFGQLLVDLFNGFSMFKKKKKDTSTRTRAQV